MQLYLSDTKQAGQGYVQLDDLMAITAIKNGERKGRALSCSPTIQQAINLVNVDNIFALFSLIAFTASRKRGRVNTPRDNLDKVSVKDAINYPFLIDYLSINQRRCIDGLV